MAEVPESEEFPPPGGEPADGGRRNKGFQDLEILQQEVERRIRDNQRFLERFMDDDFDEEDDPEEGEEIFEEL